MGAIPIEGLVGRIVGDTLIHYLNVAGAYIVCTTVLAVALYLTTAFSFSAIEVWAPTRFAFVIALRDRWQRLAGQSAQRKASTEGTGKAPRRKTCGHDPAGAGPSRAAAFRESTPGSPRRKSSRSRACSPQTPGAAPASSAWPRKTNTPSLRRRRAQTPAEIEVTERADIEHKPKDHAPQNCRQLQAAALEPAAPSRRAAIRA